MFRPRLAVLLVALSAPVATADPGAALLRCQDGIARVAARFVGSRLRALERCVGDALRCPGTLDPRATAPTDCMDRAGRRCRAGLGRLAGAARRLDAAGPRCARRDGISTDALLADDGLGFDGIAALCPADPPPADAAAASRCQRAALSCTANATFAAVVPRGLDILRRLGTALPDPETCVTATLCGNGELDGNEECDDGPANSDTTPDACRTNCTEARCGDGVVDSDEECDDGNVVDGDGCASDCTLEGGEAGTCGDGVVQDDEECDDGAANSDVLPDHCRTDCTAPTCGDGVVDAGHGEQCEPPGSLLCTARCRWLIPVPGHAALAPAVRRDTVAGDALGRCQAAIVRAGGAVFSASRRLVGGCALRAAACTLASPDQSPDAACAAQVGAACSAVPYRVLARQAHTMRWLARRCASGDPPAPLPVAVLLTELDFGALAAGCPVADPAQMTPAELFDCILAGARCTGEDVVAETVPRAMDFIDATDADAETLFPCLGATTDAGSNS